MNILLINPAQQQRGNISTFGNNPGTAIIPYNLLCLATFLNANGHKCRIFDAYAEDCSLDNLANALGDASYDLVGITSFTVTAPYAFQTADAIRKFYPNVLIVYGGIHATVMPEESLRECPSLDCVVAGEGEVPLLALADALRDNTDPKLCPGTIWRTEGGGFAHLPKPNLECVENLPIPDYSLLTMSHYNRPHAGNFKRLPTFSFYCSRGCPFNCAFCSANVILGRKARYKSIENAIAEIKILVEKYGAQGLNFQDSTFTVNRSWVIDFCKALKDNGISLLWRANSRADCLDPELLTIMKSAGCHRINVGFESGNVNTLRLLNKKTTLQQNIEAAKIICDSGLELGASFIIGLPSEGPTEVLNTIRFARTIGARFTQFYLPVPFPGTKLRDICEGCGLRNDAQWKDYSSRDFSNAVYINPNFSASAFKKLPSIAYRSFYFNGITLLRQLVTLGSWSEFMDWLPIVRKAFKMGLQWQELRLKQLNGPMH
jgi:radical SAM superfamily enzyme YgiQ (UPF0313 family)